MANVKRTLTCVLGAVFALASLSAELTKKDLRKIKKQVKSGTIVAPEMTESSDLPNIVKCLEEKCLKYDTEKQLKSVKCVTLDLSKTQIKNIGDSAFEGCIWLEAIMIPDGVTRISDSAFCSTQGLKSVVLPSSVTQIGSKAFKDCEKLAHLKLPPKVEKIGDEAFSGCTSLTSINIPDCVTEISTHAFRGCTALTSLEIPANVAVIGIWAFSGCTSLELITIAEGVTEIGSEAFKDCESLTSIEIPSSVNLIGSSAFRGCTELASITIAEGVTEIGDGAFRGCTALASLEIPASVAVIGIEAFRGCTQLASITIAEGVTEIGSWAFSICTRLTSLEIPASVTVIGSWAFSDCTKLASITIAEGVTEIGDGAFTSCKSLTSIDIPASVKKIGDGMFEECTGLEAINVASGNPYFFSKQGLLFGTDGNEKTLLFRPNGNTSDNFTIPDGVTEIPDEAFIDCRNLVSVEIPSSVTRIGNRAFAGCSRLTSVAIPDGVKEIGSDAFRGCTALTSLEIPASVTKIGKRMITGCTALMEQKVPKVLLAAIDEGAMKDMTKEVLFDYCAKCLEARYTREDLAMQYTACVVRLEVMWQGLVKVDSLSQHFADEEKRIERIYGNRLNWFMYDAMIARYKEYIELCADSLSGDAGYLKESVSLSEKSLPTLWLIAQGDVVLQNPMQAALDVVSNTADIKAYASLMLTKYTGERLARQCATSLYALRIMKYYVEYLHAVYNTCLNNLNNYVKTYPPDAELSMLRSGSYAVSNYTRQGILERYLPMASKTREAFASFALEVRGSAGIVYQDDVERLVSANGRGAYTNRGVLRMPVLDGISEH